MAALRTEFTPLMITQLLVALGDTDTVFFKRRPVFYIIITASQSLIGPITMPFLEMEIDVGSKKSRLIRVVTQNVRSRDNHGLQARRSLTQAIDG